ncbi:hypothetical protein AJGP001_10995 [Planococcus faecalis]|uniref:XRE family transcriptional regulator n=2 Tax=Planococcus faecalis TaxID=1598147 RepID=A0ABM6ITV8_9BACL|nr:hypothetical protein [Planococcus faecalis]AQU79760.1 hypothetical protein AJGP001_10995 [Planococcus faecalis]
MKRSAKVGSALNRLLEGGEETGERIALDLNVSPQLISHIKNDRRTMQSDIAKESITLYDNPEYTMDILYEFSGGMTSPVLRGKNIEQHRLAFKANAAREIEEGLEMIKKVCLAKPPSTLDAYEKESVLTMMDELLDARIHIDNLLMQVQIEYKVSIKERIKSLIPRWKAKGWLA